jgi:hypothetical protein
MGTDKEDTDPSSPSALRPSSQRGLVAARAVADSPSGQPTTDPGLGPSSAPPPSSVRRPMGVTVPAPSVRPRPGPSAITPPEITPIAAPLSATPSSTKDSVELLLEGMTGPRAERRKTTPQSDGEASAAYHAEHGVRRARTSEPAGPKVVVERPAAGAVLRDRRPSPVPSKPGAREPGSREAMSTFVPARVLRRRAAMALVAGVLFVLLSFMALRLTGRHGNAQAEATFSPAPLGASIPSGASATTTASPSEPPPPVEPPSPVEPAHAAGVVEAVAPGAQPPVAQAPATATSGHAPSGAASSRHHHASDAPAPPPTDLGEFKSKF